MGKKKNLREKQSTTSSNTSQSREVLQTESGSIFGKVHVKVLAGQGQSTHEHVRTESLFCKQKIDFRFHFRFGQLVRPVPMAKRLVTFKKILAETLLLSSHKVAK